MTWMNCSFLQTHSPRLEAVIMVFIASTVVWGFGCACLGSASLRRKLSGLGGSLLLLARESRPHRVRGASSFMALKGGEGVAEVRCWLSGQRWPCRAGGERGGRRGGEGEGGLGFSSS